VRISPREIQAHIRGGLSAEDVAELTGASLEYVQRFERPIIAEREHIVAQALAVPVRITADVDVLGENATFGTAIRDRLASLGASAERWASWREDEAGWIVKLTFTADDIEHDARWTYEPRKAHLVPANAEASTLSQHGELPPAGLIPRLRAVPLVPDESRFDSGQFEFVESHRPEAAPAPAPAQSHAPTIPAGAIKRADDDQPRDVHNTADLLEALRRRRGEREASTRDSQPIELELPPVPDDDGAPQPRDEHPSGPIPVTAGGFTPRETGPVGVRGSSKRGRASMPSWDEIVFGARGDDDTSA
jgi:hypothetical protein